MGYLRPLTRKQAKTLAIHYVNCGCSKAKAYKLFNPLWSNLKPQSVRNNTYQAFGQPLVRSMISDIQTTLVETSMAKLQLSMDTQLAKQERLYEIGIEKSQLSAAVSAVKDQNNLLKLYDQITDDAVVLDMKMTRPTPKAVKAAS